MVEKCKAFDLLHGWLRSQKVVDDGEGGYDQMLEICAEAVRRGSADGILEQWKGCTEYRAWVDIRYLLDVNNREEDGVYEFVRSAVLYALEKLRVEDGKN